ncbi:MAG: AbgT family transporter [Ignavibacteria bacterium]|nr:AbgT family transporter [Ignavibacteria bacterium]
MIHLTINITGVSLCLRKRVQNDRVICQYSRAVRSTVTNLDEKFTIVECPDSNVHSQGFFVPTHLQKYEKDTGIGTIIATMLPYTIGWSLFLIAWMSLGIPVGPSAGLYLDATH